MCFFFPLALFLSLSQPCCWCMCACVCASVWKRTKYKTKLQWHSSNQLYYVHHPVVALGREQPKNGTPKNQNFGSSKKKKTQIYSAHLGAFHHVHHLSSRGFSRWHIHITFYLTDFLSLHRTPFFFPYTPDWPAFDSDVLFFFLFLTQQQRKDPSLLCPILYFFVCADDEAYIHIFAYDNFLFRVSWNVWTVATTSFDMIFSPHTTVYLPFDPYSSSSYFDLLRSSTNLHDDAFWLLFYYLTIWLNQNWLKTKTGMYCCLMWMCFTVRRTNPLTLTSDRRRRLRPTTKTLPTLSRTPSQSLPNRNTKLKSRSSLSRPTVHVSLNACPKVPIPVS